MSTAERLSPTRPSLVIPDEELLIPLFESLIESTKHNACANSWQVSVNKFTSAILFEYHTWRPRLVENEEEETRIEANVTSVENDSVSILNYHKDSVRRFIHPVLSGCAFNWQAEDLCMPWRVFKSGISDMHIVHGDMLLYFVCRCERSLDYDRELVDHFFPLAKFPSWYMHADRRLYDLLRQDDAIEEQIVDSMAYGGYFALTVGSYANEMFNAAVTQLKNVRREMKLMAIVCAAYHLFRPSYCTARHTELALLGKYSNNRHEDMGAYAYAHLACLLYVDQYARRQIVRSTDGNVSGMGIYTPTYYLLRTWSSWSLTWSSTMS